MSCGRFASSNNLVPRDAAYAQPDKDQRALNHFQVNWERAGWDERDVIRLSANPKLNVEARIATREGKNTDRLGR